LNAMMCSFDEMETSWSSSNQLALKELAVTIQRLTWDILP
jgi:hypothetical protein